MPNPIRPLLAALGLLFLPVSAHADWKPVEKIVPYKVSGQTGIELYQSIGHRGPTAGKGVRAIALTSFKLTWKRDYQRRGSSCVLAAAVPKLVITYTLPEAAERLPEPLASRWKTFRDGIAAHERVHGEQIIDMVRQIEAATIGFTEENDPGCKRIYSRIEKRLGEISRARQEASNEFDRVEMGPDGTIARLVLALVNGG